jgi:hypothetical protein
MLPLAVLDQQDVLDEEHLLCLALVAVGCRDVLRMALARPARPVGICRIYPARDRSPMDMYSDNLFRYHFGLTKQGNGYN